MKKVILFIIMLTILAPAKRIKRFEHSTLEIAPKASLYIGEDAHFGLGAECVINPVKSLGVRLSITEVIFGDGTQFYLNYGGWGFGGLSLDGLFYIPVQNLELYVHSGLGVGIVDTPGPGDTHTFFSFRFGMGMNYPINPGTKFFIEPGIIIYDAGNNTESMFRLSFGVKFGIL